MIHAIPTRYKGVQMRSRLEARWAAFFDLLQWEWHYEPYDLNGWIPDFALGSDLTTAALVEIKPIDWGSQHSIGEALNNPGIHEAEIIRASRVAPKSIRGVLICGLRPIWDDSEAVISWRIGPVWEPQHERWILSSAAVDLRTGITDFSVGRGEPYLGLATGHDYTSGDLIDEIPGDFGARELWIEAGNIIQWKRPT